LATDAVSEAQESLRRLIDNVEKVILGKRPVIEHAMAALLAQGHILVEDLPGVGKTTLAKSLAVTTGCSFKRIQFTPDLLPTDITGISVYNQKTEEFQFRPGPVMSQVVLADEINRATPKTQSALLEAMEERQVTSDGISRPLESPFFVMATQNPIEYEGTFPLPEAQLDRFLLRLSLGYPGRDEELSIIDQQEKRHPIETLEPVARPEEISALQEESKNVYVDPLLRSYIVNITDQTRTMSDVGLGASPRATLGLFKASRALALVRGRDYVLPDDIQELAEEVIAHRIIVSVQARIRGVDGRSIVTEVLGNVPVPGVRSRPAGPRSSA
jgi:MoxR-like ATPase